MPIDPYLLGTGFLLLLALVANRLATRFGVPSLLLFLAIGMLCGSDGPGGIPFDSADQAQALGTVALIFIMFHGGLETHWHHVRPVVWQAVSLATVGVLVSTVLVGAVAHASGQAGWTGGLLLGAMVSSTDAAALFSVMRSQGLSLKGNLNALLELESGSNDPMAVFLTATFVEALTGDVHFSIAHALGDLMREMVVGAFLGVALGRVLVYLVRRVDFDSEGMYVVLTTGMTLFIYGLTQVLLGSGFLAVYLAGLVLGSYDFPHKRILTDANDGIAWLMQIAMFLALGLLVYPSQLPSVARPAILLGIYLVFVARPVAVFVALAFTRLNWREKLLVSWCGLRGAVPIILATFPMLANVQDAWGLFNIVFFMVIVSVLLQGTSVPWIADRLGLRSD
jgi:cell volume regulation protein A